MDQPPAGVLAAFGLTGAAAAPLGNGLINQTWLLTGPDGRRVVLQRLSGLFPPEINRDIDTVTRHLAQLGQPTTLVLRTLSGHLWHEQDAAAWRLLTHVEGVSHDRLPNPDYAAEAGALLGRFHKAVNLLDIEFANERLGVHDTARHLAMLRAALKQHRGHRNYAAVAELAEDILRQAESLPALPASGDRIVHGDPKANNIIFAERSAEARCLIDLDTLTYMPVALELGDALRSWCNRAGEDSAAGALDAEMFAAALAGYAGEVAGWLRPAERDAIVPATQTILVELAARFCADALNESYFGWDRENFATASDHNLVRAAGQAATARSLLCQRDELEELVARYCALD